MGTYRKDDIVLYNDAIEWSPVSIEGNILVYSVQSNGKFYIYDNARSILFDFVVNTGQDFAIDSIWSPDFEKGGIPKAIIVSDTYWQRTSFNKPGALIVWVKSTGADIESLAVTGTNGAVGYNRVKPDGYGKEWAYVAIDVNNVPTNSPCDLIVGNVLVAHVERIAQG